VKRSWLKRNQHGLTLVEVLVSVSVAALLLSALSAPIAVGIINRRQGQDLTQATNIAQLQIESIRSGWGLPAQDATSAYPKSVGQSNYDNNQLLLAWKQPGAGCIANAVPNAGFSGAYNAAGTNLVFDSTDNSTTPPTNVLQNPASIAPNSNLIPAAVRAIPIDTNNDCVQDYWGQIMLANVASNTVTSGASSTSLGTKRVVIRIFRLQTNPTTLSYTPVNAQTPIYNGSGIPTRTDGTSYFQLPVVVLVADIARS
jgi:prepilin-type N-terminal cleavage/methylation domain-containing protein